MNVLPVFGRECQAEKNAQVERRQAEGSLALVDAQGRAIGTPL